MSCSIWEHVEASLLPTDAEMIREVICLHNPMAGGVAGWVVGAPSAGLLSISSWLHQAGRRARCNGSVHISGQRSQIWGRVRSEISDHAT